MVFIFYKTTHMRHKFLITLISIASGFQVYAQCNPKEYAHIFNEAVELN